MRGNKGITLIIVVLTVVILAILVLLSIDLVVNKKLFSKSKTTVEKANNQLAQDQNIENSLLEDWDETTGTSIKTGTKAPPCREHKYGEWQITQPTCLLPGKKTRECTVCGAKQTTTSGAARGHNYVDGVCSRCGAEEPKVTVKPGVLAKENAGYTDDAGNTAIIPKGFTVSGKNSEKTIEGGLVIYLINDKTEEEIKAINWNDEVTLENLKKTYDQFVWIPVLNVNSMFMCQSEGTDIDASGTVEDDEYNSCKIVLDSNDKPYCKTHNSALMAGRLYATVIMNSFSFNSSLTTQTYNANSGIREPAIITGKADGTGTDFDGSNTNNNIGLTLATLQEEYNNAVKKVIESKGFWIGRYETSGMSNSNSNDSTTILSVVAGKGTGDGINNVNWYRMYKQQQNYVNKKELDTSKIQSTMVFGAAYDQTVLFANCAKKTTPKKDFSTVMTGNVETDCYKNIYDLCGNLIERTTEAYGTVNRVFRGRPF